MRRWVLSAISFYRHYVSPTMLPACRFVPSCSQYAAEAIEKYGVSKGSWLALKRLLRCQPFAESGYDPLR